MKLAVLIRQSPDPTVIRLDPATGEIRRTEPLHAPTVASGYGFGAAWAVVAPGDLKRIDPQTMTVTRTTPNVAFTSEGAEPKLLFTQRELLVASPASAWIAHVDRNGALKAKRDLNGLTSATLANGDVWTTTSAGLVARLGSGHGARAGILPRDVAAGAGAVWVADYTGGTVKRVRTADGSVVATIRLHRMPVALAAGGRTVAVAVTEPPLGG
jgi:hypothetical protein